VTVRAGPVEVDHRDTLATTFDAVAPHLPAELVRADQVRRLRALAGRLPPVAVAGLECRLTGEGPVDLAIALPTSDRCFTLVAGHNPERDLAPALLAEPGWQRVRGLARAITPPDGILAGAVDQLWLEYDMPATAGSSPPKPKLFFSPDPSATMSPQRYLDVTGAVLTALGSAPLARPVRDRLLEVIARLPAGSAVFQIGIPVAQRIDALRLCISGLDGRAMVDTVRSLGWAHDPGSLRDTVGQLARRADDLYLDIDVGEQVGERISVEAHLRGPRRPVAEPGWVALLDWLLDSGLCRADRRQALLAWPGVSVLRPDAATAHGPSAVAGLFGGRATLGVMRGLHHLKVSYEAGTGWQAKGYFGFKRHWLIRQPAGVTAPVAGIPAPPAPGRTRSGRPARWPQVLQGGVSYLAAGRGPAGWWHDFDLAAGPGDMWITAYVATMLAEVRDERAARLVGEAWELLDRHRHGNGGWGYHTGVPADADTTVWVLRLAEQVAAPTAGTLTATGPGSARAFLERHRRTDGGLATYAEAEPIRAYMGLPASVSYHGWTASHPCVSAAAANLRLAGDRFDAYLAATQQPDGDWPAYWWVGDEYPTSQAVSALSRRDVPRRAGAPRADLAAAAGWLQDRLRDLLAQPEHQSAFAIACCVRALAIRDGDPDGLLRAAARRLTDAQLEDGSWPASARLRVPPPDCRDPRTLSRWVPGGRREGGVTIDLNRMFTTATALSALAAVARRPTAGGAA
jgi:hypothetical protein